MKDDQRERLRLRLAEHQTPGGSGKPLIVEGVLTFQSLGINPADAQVLESRKFSVEEIARLFDVPASIIGHNDARLFHNSGQQSLAFATHSLRPLCKRTEAAVNKDVLGGNGLSKELDMSTLTRGDDLARWQSYALAISTQVLDPNEVRSLEGWRPRPPGAVLPTTPAALPTLPEAVPPTTSAGSLS